MTFNFTENDIYELEELALASVFAWRKRKQHALGKINLNVDSTSTIHEHTVEECEEGLQKSLDWIEKLYEVRQ
tara:strand:+ start:316 stop:534 length:219 start_codon:yes stop_codon:yes gene_type:complete